MKTAMSEMLIDNTVKPISSAPLRAACIGFMPFSMWRVMFSITTIASSTTNPVAMVSAISERLSSVYPIRYIAPKVAMMRNRHRDAGNERRPAAAQEDEHHQDHQPDGNDHVALGIVNGIAGGDACGRWRS